MKKGIWLLVIPLLAGCAIRPVVGPARVYLEVMGRPVVDKTNLDPYDGEVVFRGTPGIKTEAKVLLDGQYITTISAGSDEQSVGWQKVSVQNFGPHLLSGDIFLVRNDGVRIKVKCFRQPFNVSTDERNGFYYWWRVEIWSFQC